MKIIDAYWEKRNLGVDAKEIEFCADDTVAAFFDFDKMEQTPYMVVKIPSGRNDLVDEISKRGYQFIENNIQLTHNLKTIPIKPSVERFIKKTTVSKMNDDDIKRLFVEIGKNIFTTDRIYLDSMFSKGQAATRYINWIKDLIAKGTMPCKIDYNGETCAFFIQSHDKESKIAHGVLGGVYSDYDGGGFGLVMELQGLFYAKECGMKALKTAVSSNNLPVVQIMADIGFAIRAINSVFIKHRACGKMNYSASETIHKTGGGGNYIDLLCRLPSALAA